MLVAVEQAVKQSQKMTVFVEYSMERPRFKRSDQIYTLKWREALVTLPARAITAYVKLHIIVVP